MVCGSVTEDDIKQSVIRVNGSPPSAEQNKAISDIVASRLMPTVGLRVCEELIVENGELIKYGYAPTLGIQLPGKPAAWVGRGEGYKVASR